MRHDAEPLAFAHIGDLHLTRARKRNFADFLAIVAQIEIECACLDFVVLPGDNADDGLPSQYRLAATALKMLSVPVHVIPGDHDMGPTALRAFYAGLADDTRLPKAVTVRGRRCLFLDICGPGTGKLDFRLGDTQRAWIRGELEDAEARRAPSLVFMHSYPADLKGPGETHALNALLEQYDVALVDIGHTHYNEIANNGRTIFAATRSTGQIDEGVAGYSIVTVDDGVVGWRFRLLDDPFPFVAITTPADGRLVRSADQALSPGEPFVVRTLVFGHEEIATVSCRLEGGGWHPMTRDPGCRTWSTMLQPPDDGPPVITVRAITVEGRLGVHTVRSASRGDEPAKRTRDGSDAASIGSWLENGILGTQLGPNRSGRKW